jgi:16S rRNA processing protein RimM
LSATPDAHSGGSEGETAPARVPLGRVGRAHGLDGSFYITRPNARLLASAAEVSVAGRLAAIVRRAGTDRHPIVRLEGVTDRAGAEALRGAELSVPRALAPQLAEGEWWAHELEGCTVTDGELVIGTVARMIELPSCEALEVSRGEGSQPLLIPMVKDAVRRVVISERRIEVSVDFLDLAAQRTAPTDAPPADAPPTDPPSTDAPSTDPPAR